MQYTKNMATYPDDRTKMIFCDWLKAQGLIYSDIDEPKKTYSLVMPLEPKRIEKRSE
ncbi:MAG: hypothetical protein V1899_12145 [Planctomycetota bacterium]